MEYNLNRGRSRGRWYMRMWQTVLKLKIAVVFIVIIAAVISSAYLIRSCRGNALDVYVDDKIDITPAQITAMTEIGEWEFLSVEDEEMVDTVRKGWFSDDKLIRVYYGTLRLGFDMRGMTAERITKDKDTLVVALPPVGLLDEDFIDETRTQSFFESGRWTDKDRAALYDRAYIKMKNRCLTDENVKTAENNAVLQFTKLMKSLGFDKVRIVFK